MKKTFITLIASVLTICSTQAQTVTVTNVPNLMPAVTPATPHYSISAGVSEIYNALSQSGLATATNFAIEPYFTYMPSAPNGNKVGGGILAVYNVNDYIGAGIGIDYLGRFSLVSANFSLKAPIHLGNYLPANWAWASNTVVAPFTLTGIGKTMSGSTDNGISALADVGVYVQYGNLWGGKFNVGACWGQWINAGEYSGNREHLFVGWSKGF